jgi:hypothetical protein
MGILSALTNVAKAGIAVAVSPVTLIADVVTLPASAHDNKDPFHRTGRMFSAAAKCINEAVTPEKEHQ